MAIQLIPVHIDPVFMYPPITSHHKEMVSVNTSFLIHERHTKPSVLQLRLRMQGTPFDNVLMGEFVARYEELVELLCSAVQEGIVPERSEAYLRVRDWMCKHYHKVEHYLAPFWSCIPEITNDPFKILFSRPQLDEVIHTEGVFSSLYDTRRTIEDWQRSLT